MSVTIVNVERVISFQDAAADPSKWAVDLRENSGETEIAALTLADGNVYAMKKSDERFEKWADFVARSYEAGRSIYVEANEGSRTVERILAPLRRRIEDVASVPEGSHLRVVIFTAPSIHLLNLNHPRFEQMRVLLVEAATTGGQVLVTTDPDNGEIIDVRSVEGEPEPPDDGDVLAEEKTVVLFKDLTDHFFSRSTLSEQDAEIHFDDLARQKHIPFIYPFDCCTARAHEMCRLLRTRGITPRKIWNYGRGWTRKPKVGTLRVVTPNAPGGVVTWTYHVAPVVSVEKLSGAIVKMVFDPSIFSAPVSPAVWRDRQQDDSSLWEITEDKYYYRDYFDFSNQNALFDSRYRETKHMLSAHWASVASKRS